MKFLDLVNENKDGLVFIDRLRNTIKDICSEKIKNNFENVTQEDIDKLYLMLESAFIVNMLDDDFDINTLTSEEAELLLDFFVGFHKFCNGIEKNKRESYKNLMWDVIYHMFSIIENDEEICNYSHSIKNVYESMALEESGFENSGYNNFDEYDLNRCLSDIYIKIYLKI